MKKHIIVITLMLMAVSYYTVSGQLSAKEIITKSREVSKMDGMEAVTKLQIFDSRGNVREREIIMVSRIFDGGSIEKRVIRFIAPAEVKGTGMLICDYENKNDDMWIYMPALRKTRRIVSSEKGKSFMGSEFSNADMSAPNIDDWTYKLLGSEIVDGTDCWKIEVVPANENIADETGINKKISWFGKQDFVIRKSEYYDPDGDLWKILSASQVKNLANGKYMAAHMRMENVQSGRKSEFTMDQIQYNPQVNEEYFTVNYLEIF